MATLRVHRSPILPSPEGSVRFPRASTLLDALWESGGDAESVAADLESGSLRLTGSFREREADVASDFRSGEES